MNGERLVSWEVDYGQGPVRRDVPHVWGEDADIRWEGPAKYRAEADCGGQPQWLYFEGVSYEAVVRVDGAHAATHRGIWDGFSIPLGPGRHEIEVEVTKNGGNRFPVPEVLSGFYPYVYGTFGGVYRDVWLVPGAEDPAAGRPALPPRVELDGCRLRLDGRPWTMRGVLDWGWHPARRGPTPSRDEFRRLLAGARSLGLNTVKFCLWMPPHWCLDMVDEAGMLAWLELPLWMPRWSEAWGRGALDEVRRIVTQYRGHRAVVAWTCGCELGAAVPHEFRQSLVQTVQGLTGCPLVKDTSGGAEMYGADLREYGTFADFHPYCDTQWYLPVLESLRPGPREAVPSLLGECNDYDAFRPLGPLGQAMPFWASDDPAVNDQGVRWQWDVPRLVRRPVRPDEERLRAASERKSRWVRRTVCRLAASQPEIAGYVLTGAYDTPISTSGVLEEGRFEPGDFGPFQAFLGVPRQPPWSHGGNRPGWRWPYVMPSGEGWALLGMRSERDFEGPATVRIEGRPDEAREVRLLGGVPACREGLRFAGRPGARIRVEVECEAGADWFDVSFWEPWIAGHASPTEAAAAYLGIPPGGQGPVVAMGWEEEAAEARREGRPLVVLCLDGPGLPFFRECVHAGAGLLPEDDFDSWLCVACSSVLGKAHLGPLEGSYETLMERVDTRTYSSAPVVVRSGRAVLAALRPAGGEGVQPSGLATNAAGAELMRRLVRLVSE